MDAGPFGRVVATIRGSAADTAGPTWVLHGLAVFMREAVAADRGHDPEPRAVGEWLAQIPLPPIDLQPRAEAVDRELTLLRSGMFPDPRHAERFEGRVRAHLLVHTS